MKKILILSAILVILTSSCERIYVGNTTPSRPAAVPINKGDTRLTITKDYIIVEVCEGDQGGYNLQWTCTEIVRNDTTQLNSLNGFKIVAP